MSTKSFSNGSITLTWINEDTIELKNEWGHTAYIDGGDFESIVNALISTRNEP